MVIPLNPQQFPSAKAKMTNQDGTPTVAFYYLLQSMYNRGGGPTGIISNVAAGLAAAGSAQSTATQLTHDFGEVLTGAGGVRITAVQPGQQHFVFNGTGSNINVYPPTNGQINGLGVNNPYVLGSGKTQQIWATSIMANGGTQYRTTILG